MYRHETTPIIKVPKTMLLFGVFGRLVILSSVLLLLLVYVVQTSRISTKGYDMSTLRKEIRVLEEETRKMTVEVATYRSLQYIEQRLESMPLVRTTDAVYVETIDSAVARR